jgi:hypothetical protein
MPYCGTASVRRSLVVPNREIEIHSCIDTTTLQYRHMRCKVANEDIRYHIQSGPQDLLIPIITCKLSNDTQMIILEPMS